MTSMIEVFPVEIIEEILNIIADDDDRQHRCKWPNIKACSLTCRLLAALCRRHIFRCIKLVDFNRSPRQVSSWKPPQVQGPHSLARSFAKLIVHKPEIADLVREVDVMLNSTEDGSRVSSVVALGRLKKVEKLCVYPISGTNARNWQSTVHPVSQTIILTLMHCPTLTHVKFLSMFSFLISDLAPCTHLRSLTLQDGSIEEDDAPLRSSGASIQLQELNTVFPCPRNIAKLLKLKYNDETPIFDIRGLKKFRSCVIGKSDHTKYSAEVIRCAKLLEDIHLYVILRQDESPQTITNMLSPSLRTLRFLSLSCRIEPSMSDYYYDIHNSLKNLSPTNRIESLNLGFQAYQGFRQTIRPDYEALKECILGLGWPSLTQVNLSIFNWCEEDGYLWEGSTLQDSSVTIHRLSSNSLLEFRVYNYKGSMDMEKGAYGC